MVIGIDDYRDPAWPRLSNAVRDANAVAEALKRQGFKVTIKMDLAAAALKTELRDFFIKVWAEKNARLLLWYARARPYLVPADAPAPVTGPDFLLKALPLRRFGEYMRLAQSRHALAIFVACFASTVFNTARSLSPAAITRATILPVRQMISSGDAEQRVLDDGMFRELPFRIRDTIPGRTASSD